MMDLETASLEVLRQKHSIKFLSTVLSDFTNDLDQDEAYGLSTILYNIAQELETVAKRLDEE